MRILFAIALSLTLISAAIMGSLAKRFRFKDGHTFTIMNLEMPGSEEALKRSYGEMTVEVREIVKQQLHADYFFMFGCYPFVALLAIAVARDSGKTMKKIFVVLAALQVLPFVFDVTENIVLEKWMPVGDQPSSFEFNFGLFQTLVASKFAIALITFVAATSILGYRALTSRQVSS